MRKKTDKKINLKGFVVKFVDGNKEEFYTKGSKVYSSWVDTDVDLRLAKIFNSEKIAQRFVDNRKRGEKCDCFGGCVKCDNTGRIEVQDTRYTVEPVSKYVATGYIEVNCKAVKQKCFQIGKYLFPLVGKRTYWGVESRWVVYKTAAECLKDSIRDVKSDIKDIKNDIKDKLKELKDLEKKLKLLNSN